MYLESLRDYSLEKSTLTLITFLSWNCRKVTTAWNFIEDNTFSNALNKLNSLELHITE